MVLLVASSAQSEDVFTTLFYDPAQLALVSSSGGPDEVLDPGGLGSKGLVLVPRPKSSGTPLFQS